MATTVWPGGLDPAVAATMVTVAVASVDATKTAFTTKSETVQFIVTVNFASPPAVAGRYAWTVTEDNWPLVAGSYFNAGHQINATSVPKPPPQHLPPTVTATVTNTASDPALSPFTFTPGELGSRTLYLSFQIQAPADDVVNSLTSDLDGNLLALVIDTNTTVPATPTVPATQLLTGHASLLVATAGTKIVTVTAGNSQGGTSSESKTFTVVVPTGPIITSADHTKFTVGQAGSFPVAATGSPAPTYGITGQPSWLSISSVTGVLQGTPPASAAGQYNITISASNGVSPDATQAFTLNVFAPPVFTSADNATVTLGQAINFTVIVTGNPTPVLSWGGLPPGLTGLKFDTGTGLLSGTPTSAAGSPFTITFAANNDVSPSATQDFTLTVNKLIATVTLTGLSATYDGTPKSVTATTSPGGLQVALTYAGSSTAPTNAGSYAVVATINDPNYQGSASDTLLIAKAPLTIIADNKTRAYGDPNPPLAVSFVGFVHGDTALVISGLRLSTAATATSVPGTYAIVASGATATNYTSSFVKGTLTITKANQTIPFGPLPTKTVGDPKFTLPATASSGLTVTYISSSTAVATVSGNTVTIVGAGSTTITASQAGNANYNRAPNVTQTLTVAGAKSYSLCGTVFFDINYNGVFDAIGEDDDDHWNGDDHGSSSYGNGDWSDCRGSRNDRFSDRGRGSDYGDRSASRDCDNDDEQHAEDFGLGGVTVNLLNSKGKVIATLVTNADGTYCFSNLAPGNYTVSAVEPNGYDATTQTTRSATITNKNVIVRDIGMGLDLTEIRRKHADGHSDDFWHTQLDKCIKGDSKNVQVSASTCTAHTKKIGSLALSVFDDITMKSARSLLENNGRSSRDQLSRQLIAAEYNYSNGAYIDGDKILTYCFIQWGERVCKYPSAYSNSYAQWAADWFEAYNTSGGGNVGGPQ